MRPLACMPLALVLLTCMVHHCTDALFFQNRPASGMGANMVPAITNAGALNTATGIGLAGVAGLAAVGPLALAALAGKRRPSRGRTIIIRRRPRTQGRRRFHGRGRRETRPTEIANTNIGEDDLEKLFDTLTAENFYRNLTNSIPFEESKSDGEIMYNWVEQLLDQITYMEDLNWKLLEKMETEGCFQRFFCSAATGRMNDPLMKGSLADVIQALTDQFDSNYTAKFVRAIKYGASRRDLKKCEYRYKCTILDSRQELEEGTKATLEDKEEFIHSIGSKS